MYKSGANSANIIVCHVRRGQTSIDLASKLRSVGLHIHYLHVCGVVEQGLENLSDGG